MQVACRASGAATLDLPTDKSLMQAIMQNDINGVVAECGGSAMCATCHVYIAEEQLHLLPEMDFVEDEMLGSTAAQCVRARVVCLQRRELGA
jgi:2Fe-2S ferredoxin